jgi:NADH-quinone oxidoreductase subunit N
MDFISTFSNNLRVLVPELFIVIALSFLIVYGAIYATSKKHKYPVIRPSMMGLTVLTLTLTLMLVMNNPYPAQSLMSHTLIHDPLTNGIKAIVLILSTLTIIASKRYIKVNNLHAFEYQIIIIIAVLGLIFIVASNDIISLYLAVEIQSLSLYVLAAFKRGSAFSTEASLKYFILGAFSSGLLLFGSSLIYGFVGSTNFEDIARLLTIAHHPDVFVASGLIIGVVFVSCGLLFKIGAAPFHMWLPDVYEGAPSSVTTLFAVTPKLVLIGLTLRILYVPFYDLIEWWQQVFIVASASSMILATFAAMYQKRLKRFLAYSSIGNIGYILIGLSCGTLEGIQSVLIYTVIYVIVTLNMWTILISIENKETGKLYRYITDLGNLNKSNPILAAALVVTILSFAGIPPLAGFCAKLYVFFAAMASSMYIIAIVGILTSVVGAFYYLRWIKVLYFEKNKGHANLVQMDRGKSLIISTTTFFIMFFFANPTGLLLITHNMAIALV